LQSHVLIQIPLQSPFKHKVTPSVTVEKIIFLSSILKIDSIVLKHIDLNNERYLSKYQHQPFAIYKGMIYFYQQ
jgi:hypothetical protein